MIGGSGRPAALRGLWRCAIAGLLPVLPASASAAEPVQAALEWQSPPEPHDCLDRGALEAAVEARLGRRVFSGAADASVRVHGRVDALAAGRGFRAELELNDAEGQRLGTRSLSSRAANCSALNESLVLVVALMVDINEEQIEVLRQQQAPPPKDGAAAGPSEDGASRGGRAPLERNPWRFLAGVDLVIVGRLLPDVVPGVALSGAVAPPSIGWLELSLSQLLSSDAARGDRGSRFSLRSAELYWCPFETQRFNTHVGACLGQRFGLLAVEGFGFQQNQETSRFIYGLGAKVRASLRLLGPLTLRASAGVELPLTRDRFYFTDAAGETTLLFRPKAAVLSASAGVALQFP